MNRFLAWVYAHASPKYLIFAIMGIIPFNALLFPLMSARFGELSKGARTLDVQFGYLPADAIQQIASYGEQGRNYYLIIAWTADLLFPFVYMALFSLLLATIFKGATSPDHPFRKLASLPLFMMVADYSENIFVSLLVLTQANPIGLLAWLAALASLLKWLFGGLVALALIIGLFSLVSRVIQEHKLRPDD